MSHNERIDMLMQLIASIDDPADCRALFEDLCTAKELENMAERLHAAKMLSEGKTYSQVMESVQISSAPPRFPTPLVG